MVSFTVPKISIVIGYYNRKRLLLATLHSIMKSRFVGDIELCICDDASNEQNKLDEELLLIVAGQGIDVKLDTVTKKEKT